MPSQPSSACSDSVDYLFQGCSRRSGSCDPSDDIHPRSSTPQLPRCNSLLSPQGFTSSRPQLTSEGCSCPLSPMPATSATSRFERQDTPSGIFYQYNPEYKEA